MLSRDLQLRDQRDKTMADKLMYIPNDDSQNYPICKLKLVVETLNTELNKSTNQKSLKSPKLLSQRIEESVIIKLWGTNSPFPPLSLYV